MDGLEFLNQNPCIPSWPGVFQFSTFFSFSSVETTTTFTSGTPSSPSNSFFMIFINSAFLIYSFCSHILLQNFFVSFASDCWFLCIVCRLVGWIFFRYFGMPCFVCIVWPCPGTFWVSLLSAISFDVTLPVVLSDLSVVSCLFFIPFCLYKFLLL